MVTEPQALLNYAHADDAFLGGRITALREAIEKAVRSRTAEPFSILLDRDGIRIGLDQHGTDIGAPGSVQLLIAMLSPNYFASAACRGQLQRFLALERSTERTDLVLPIIIQPVSRSAEDEDSEAGRLKRAILRRPHRDWSMHIWSAADQPESRELRELARILVETAHRFPRAAPPGAANVSDPQTQPVEPRSGTARPPPRDGEPAEAADTPIPPRLLAAMAMKDQELEDLRARLQILELGASLRQQAEQQRDAARTESQRLQAEMAERDRLIAELERRLAPGPDVEDEPAIASSPPEADTAGPSPEEDGATPSEPESAVTAWDPAGGPERVEAIEAKLEQARLDAALRHAISRNLSAAATRPRPRTRPELLLVLASAILVVSLGGLGLWRALRPASEAHPVAFAQVEPGAGPPRVGELVKDCPDCPELVVIPGGTFEMGTAAGDADERPQHPVTLPRPIAIGTTEVTFAEWDACVVDGGCAGYEPTDEGWGRGRQPAVHVSWDDARLYTAWLSARTGQTYRLPTEAEWEHAARAGSGTGWWWGDELGEGQANCDGCGSRWDDRRPAPVGSFAANAFGLYDVHGNVWEWVEDCWHSNYREAPTDGSAWVQACTTSERVLRSGSWYFHPGLTRSANRYRAEPGRRDARTGFRVVREVVPEALKAGE